MSVWQLALLIGAISAGMLVRDDRRSLIWIIAGAASFIISTAYQRSGLPGWPVATALCDAALCLLIYVGGRFQWELVLWKVWQTSVLISILYVYNWIPSRYVYVTALEVANWCALIVISGAAISRQVGHAWGSHHSSWFIRSLCSALRSIHSESRRTPWWEK